MKDKISKNIKNIKKNVIEYIISNRLFLSYVLLSIISVVMLRGITIKNAWSFKPFITDLGIILIIGALGYFVKPRNQFKYYFSWIIIYTIICVVSSVYYTFYVSFASIGELASLSQMETVTGSLFEKLRFIDFIYVLIPILFYFVHRKLSATTYYYFLDKVEKGKKMVVGTILVGTLCLGYSFGVATGTDYSRLAKQWNRIYIVERFGIIVYQINDLIQSMTPRLSSLFGYDEALESFNEYFNAKEEHQKNSYTGILNGYNIVFVHMESMETYLMDLKFNDKEVTPNLNALAKEGMFFSNFYPQVSTGTSSDTEFTLLTGLMPAASGTVFVSYYNRNYFTIPKYLKEKGYYTFSTHGNLSSMWNRNKAHPSLGYDEMYFEDRFTYTADDVVNLGINDYRYFEQVVPIMENIETTYDNYMGTMITLSNHSPFSIASTFSDYDLSITTQTINEETGEKETITTDYLSNSAIGEYIKSVNYADGALGDLIKYIKNSKEFDKTLFVFYGDHDAKLSRNEMNYLYNLNPLTGETYTEDSPEYTEYNNYEHELNKKTPLILWTKNNDLKKKFKGEITYPMGMYDVSTTILNMFGMYNKYSVGSDIFNIKDKNVIVFPNGNVLTKDLYYNNSKNEYYLINSNFKVTDEYINELKEIADKKLEISNNIIVYNLLNSVNMMGD